MGLALGFAGLAVSFLPAEPNVSLARWLFVGAAVCIVAGLVIFFWPQRMEQPTATATQSGSRNVQIQGQTINFQGTISTGEEEIPAARLPDGRTLVDVTPEHLTGLFGEHTIIQANRLVEAFIGKWMRLSGPVGDVGAVGATGEDKTNVYFSGETFGHIMVVMGFNDQSVVENQLRVLKKGDWITVIGQIQRVSPTTLGLENCELERP